MTRRDAIVCIKYPLRVTLFYSEDKKEEFFCRFEELRADYFVKLVSRCHIHKQVVFETDLTELDLHNIFDWYRYREGKLHIERLQECGCWS